MGARARGARSPKFVMTKSSRSESHLALNLQNLRAFANSRWHVPQFPMADDATVYLLCFALLVQLSVHLDTFRAFEAGNTKPKQ